jgi:hypothetical protein
MFAYDGGSYYLRVEFEQFNSPDEIAYLISNFSYVEIEEKDINGTFIVGLIRVILFVAGGFLFFFGFVGTGVFMWKMATTVISIVIRELKKNEMEELQAELLAEAEVLQQQAMEKAQLEAAIDNTTDLSYNYDFWDKYENKNPFALGTYDSLSMCRSAENQFTVGGEYWDPHTKLINKKEIL